MLTHSPNEWFNDEAVYRTAPATPGLLKIILFEPGPPHPSLEVNDPT